MENATERDRYAVIGHPVEHSLSPRIHARFAEQNGERIVYERIDATPAEFARVVGAFFAGGGRGLNVTSPHKHAAFLFADRVTAAARLAGAVNTLALQEDRQVLGDNTDGRGLIRDLVENLGVHIAGTNVLLLGAGGAARGCVGPLLGRLPARLLIANRTAAKAVALAEEFDGLGNVAGTGLAGLGEYGAFELVVNATASSLNDEVPEVPPACVKGAFCYDLTYRRGGTPFTRWALSNEARGAADGIGMLVEQAAASYELWRGVPALTHPVLVEFGASAASDGG